MDTDVILRVAGATLAGTITFPEVVQQLLAAGVEYYHVDYVRMQSTHYSSNGATVGAPIAFEGLPPVAADFNLDSLRANILDSQQKNQHHRDFSRRAVQAGVQAYYAFLRGRRVTYIGRQGDQHTEWFPGAGPRTDARN